jgi:hypothetical protein
VSGTLIAIIGNLIAIIGTLIAIIGTLIAIIGAHERAVDHAGQSVGEPDRIGSQLPHRVCDTIMAPCCS